MLIDLDQHLAGFLQPTYGNLADISQHTKIFGCPNLRFPLIFQLVSATQDARLSFKCKHVCCQRQTVQDRSIWDLGCVCVFSVYGMCNIWQSIAYSCIPIPFACIVIFWPAYSHAPALCFVSHFFFLKTAADGCNKEALMRDILYGQKRICSYQSLSHVTKLIFCAILCHGGGPAAPLRLHSTVEHAWWG